MIEGVLIMITLVNKLKKKKFVADKVRSVLGVFKGVEYEYEISFCKLALVLERYSNAPISRNIKLTPIIEQ